jgi:hypothetical protein
MTAQRQRTRYSSTTLMFIHHRFQIAPTFLRHRLLAAIALFALVLSVANASADTTPPTDSTPSEGHVAIPATTDPAEAPVPLPHLVLAPELNAAFGLGTFMAAEYGGAVRVRYKSLLVGGHFLTSPEVENGISGCESAHFCVNDRQRFGATAEFHFNPTGAIDGWVGLDVDAVHAFGQATSDHRFEARWGAAVAPKVGVDFATHFPNGLAGIGIFAALPYGGVYASSGLGLIVGVRAPFGLF